MTPAARIAAAIGVLDQVLEGQPAEASLTRWARSARYAGSKDRAAVRDHVFQALRCLRSFACLGGARTGRGLMIGALRVGGENPEAMFTGQGHAPSPLSETERRAGREPESDGERLDLPDWLINEFRTSLGEAAVPSALALRQRAPVFVRVNLRLSSVPQAIDMLAEDGIDAEPVGIAATALRVISNARGVAGSAAYRAGMVELQDGSSQAAMEVLDVPDGARVLDFCAGGGGKVLALAARADGHWFAHDVDAGRMKDLPGRAERAGVQVACLPPGRAADHAPYDLVLCDAPCSGSGTWRRAPEAKWRLTPERLEDLADRQAAILRAAAPLVRPGGILAYATCSVLRRENEKQIMGFLDDSRAWRLMDQRHWPVGADGDGFYLAQLCRG